jgi:peptidoglycan/xylan/chitin deacetylase (PgdA/CDA1 family)
LNASSPALRATLLSFVLALGLTGCAVSAAADLGAPADSAPPAASHRELAAETEVPEDEPASAAAEPVASGPAAPASASANPAASAKAGPVTVVPILMYHYIRELPPNTTDKLGYGLSVAPKLFDAQLAYLASNGYHSVSMDDVVSHITHDTPLPAKPIVLTFDDGYADFYSAALPLLQKYHATATAYIVVDFLGKPGYMSWQQVQDLRDDGFEIGAHTLDHVDLTKQPPAQLRRQVDDSRQILRQRLNVPVNTFAYPSGRENAAVVKEVATAGFASAVTTAFGSRHTAANLLTMARVRVPGGVPMQTFIKNLNG